MAEYNQYQRGGQNAAAAAWDIFQLKKLKLYGAPWDPNDGERKAPSVTFHIVNGNPRLKLYMNDGGESKALSFTFDPIIMATVLNALTKIAQNPEPNLYGWRLKSCYPHTGPRTEQVSVISTFSVGRDNKGVVYMAFQVKGMAVAKFPFTPSFYAEQIGSDGELLDPGIASSLIAEGWAKLYQDLMATYLVVRTKEPPPPQNAPPPRQNQGGSNRSASTGWVASDDDIPF